MNILRGVDYGFLGSYLPYLLRRTDQALSAAFYQALSEQGFQRCEWRVIAVLHEQGSLSMGDLTTTALSPQPTVSHAVTRLEKQGLVRRARGTADRRHRFVEATDAGHELAARLIADARRFQMELLGEAATDELSGLVNELEALQATLAARPEPAR